MSNDRKVIPLSRFDAAQPSPYHPPPPSSVHPDTEYNRSGRYLVDRARDLEENSSIAAAILSSRQANAIGPGLSYEPLVKDRAGELIPEINDAIRRQHAAWSEDVEVTGEYSRQELELLAWRTWDRDGEAFMRRVIRPQGYRIQLVPSEYVPILLSDFRNDRNIIHGVEKDAFGRPLGYYIDGNVYDLYQGGTFLDPERMLRIDAVDMWHLKRTIRPGQTRGTTLFHACMIRIDDLAAYMQSHRLAARASADLFLAINKSPDVIADGRTDEQKIHFDNLQVIELMQGESAAYLDPSHPNQNAVDFVREELRAIASATDCGFSQIAQVFDSSYAAQRLEVVDTWRKIERDRARFISDFARPALYRAVVEQMLIGRTLPARAMRRADPATLYDVRIDGPTMPVIDPEKDRKGFALDQENGWDSRAGIIRRMGRVPADVDAERDNDDFLTQSEPSNDEPIPDQSTETQ